MRKISILILFCMLFITFAVSPAISTAIQHETEKQEADQHGAKAEEEHKSPDISPFLVIPFVLMLGSIAVTPLIAEEWWENNFNKFIIALVLGVPMGVYFFFVDRTELMHTMEEYVSFILLLGSLFIISGGILVTGDIKPTPRNNVLLIAIGALIASFMGTTGASMVLIRPIINMNAERKNIKHTIIFFIFLVSNIGGCLTPLGDPPLFMGYLRGVPFAWTFGLWKHWLFGVLILLAVYYVLDSFYYKKEGFSKKPAPSNPIPFKMEGNINFLWLLGIIFSVALLRAPFREIVMVLLTALSMETTSKDLRIRNKFTFHPIIEVAYLFFGIFLTMVPALLILKAKGSSFGISEPFQFFWLTGILSSFLDNAPTYLTFLSLGQGLGLEPEIVGMPEKLLVAISIGAVFMGANTYIGNGPNFMVKAIAEENKIKMPTFLGYMLWSLIFLIPIFVVVTFLFFWF